MWWTKLIYLLLLVGLAIFSVLYIDSFAVILLLCALVLPVILFICLLWVKLASQVSLNCKKASCTVHESIPISLIAENHCPLFFPKVFATVRICHAFSEKPEKIQLRFPLHGNNQTELTFYVKADYCGALTIRIEKLYILDYFHLFRTKMKKFNNEIEILILPEKLDFALQETAPPVFSVESDQYAQDRAGDDPSEIFNIREYHEGDAVSRIHWKLSSKSDQLFIREFGFPIEKQILFVVEYLPEVFSDTEEKMQKIQAFLTLVYSFAIVLTKENYISGMAWHDENKLVYQSLRGKEQIPEIFRELYHAIDHMTLEAQDLREVLADRQYSSVTFMTNDSRAQLLPVLEHQTEAMQKNFVILTEEKNDFSPEQVAVRIIPPDRIAEGIAGLMI